jgi:RHS repeat-associated protein
MITDLSGAPSTSVIVLAGATSTAFYGQIYPFTGNNRGTTVAVTYAGITRSVDILVMALPQASLPRHDAILCASLALAPCLTDSGFSESGFSDTTLPTPLSVGDSSGYSLYTPELHLLAETEVSAAATKSIAYSYLWFGDLPVASVETSTNIPRWYATDHLGTPFLLTDAAGAVAWRAEYTPYGDVFALRAGASLHQPLRFPGQVAQDGSSLSYNVFRWYRSGWGRYSQSDPIGLQGGPNMYSYALANPLIHADPYGLRAMLACKDVALGGQPIPSVYHCRILMTKDDCCKPPVEASFGMEYTGTPPYSITEWPAATKLWDYYICKDIDLRGQTACTFGKCVRAYNNLFRIGYTGAATKYIPKYNALGPNSNSYAAKLISICGGSVDFPLFSIGASDKY